MEEVRDGGMRRRKGGRKEKEGGGREGREGGKQEMGGREGRKRGREGRLGGRREGQALYVSIPHSPAGCSEMLMANAVQELASKTPGKESVAIESFARALRQLPTIIADNAGYDSSELVSQLRAIHSEGKNTMGLGK